MKLPPNAIPSLQEILTRCRVAPGEKLDLDQHDPDWTGDTELPKKDRKKWAEQHLAQEVAALSEAQELLYAADSWSVLLIFQAMDAAGKDSTIKHVMSGINPQGCQVYSFKHPSAEELDHDFLWRCSNALPERGKIGIFNRSYFEEVLIVKVHPELLTGQRIPGADVNKKLWKERYADINAFERHLTRNGTRIVKFFLHVSPEEQRQRFLARLDDPTKHWKFSLQDMGERAYWNEYMQAYTECLEATSTDWAPWYVIPADHKWMTRMVVAQIVTHSIRSLDLQYPQLTSATVEQLEEARQKLQSEG